VLFRSGSGNANPISITSSTGTGVTLNAPVVLYSDGPGGEILIGTDLTAPSLLIFGSGSTTTLSGNRGHTP